MGLNPSIIEISECVEYKRNLTLGAITMGRGIGFNIGIGLSNPLARANPICVSRARRVLHEKTRYELDTHIP
jgi:hypothetical protein